MIAMGRRAHLLLSGRPFGINRDDLQGTGDILRHRDAGKASMAAHDLPPAEDPVRGGLPGMPRASLPRRGIQAEEF